MSRNRTLWEITWTFTDPYDGEEACHTRIIWAAPPNVTSENAADAVPDAVIVWARMIGDSYGELRSINYAVTDLLDLTDPPRDHLGAVMPGYQSTSTIHEDVYAR